MLDEIGQLTNLVHLYLHYNRIRELPPDIGQLTKLKELTLTQNPLSKIPYEIGNLTEIQRLDLEDCANLLTPPPEIINQGTPQAMNFLRELQRDSTTRVEAKLLVVGEGGTGKTTLLQALRGNAERSISTTHGIELGCYKLKHPIKDNTEITLRRGTRLIPSSRGRGGRTGRGSSRCSLTRQRSGVRSTRRTR